jgi:hypothetical protein
MAMHIRSRSAAIHILSRLFANTSADFIPLVEVFRAWGRPNPENLELHKGWLSNVMIHLKHYNLVTPGYSFGHGPRKLKEIRLTTEGKRALGRLSEIKNISDVNVDLKYSMQNPTVSDVLNVIRSFKKQNQDFDVTFSFDVKLKDVKDNQE